MTQTSPGQPSMNSVDLSCPSRPDSPIVREPPKQRKKALISIQTDTSAIPETIVYRPPIPKPVENIPKAKATSSVVSKDGEDDESSLFEYNGSSDSGQSSASSDYRPSTKVSF